MPVGFYFPFSHSTGSLGLFQMTNSELEATKSNIRVLLRTNWGERPMAYDFGCNLREFLFEQQNSDELSQRIADRIIQQVGKWMPFVSLVNLNVFFHEDDNSISPNGILLKISFAIKGKSDLAHMTELFVA